jgi:DNA processing protein
LVSTTKESIFNFSDILNCTTDALSVTFYVAEYADLVKISLFLYNVIMDHLSLSEKKYWLAYCQDESIDWLVIKKLLNHFGSLERSWNGNDQLTQLELPYLQQATLREVWLNQNPDRLLTQTQATDIKMVAITELDFPPLLKNITDPPFLLFYRGSLNFSQQISLASVGTRRASSYGYSTVKRLIRPLAKRGVVIVSGLAYGIDQASHQATLVGGGQTVAVLGGGIDDHTIYPASNRPLAHKIIKSGGALISEYPVGRSPQKHYFVGRNRIIAGLSQAVLVVEAPIKSGALITAEFALEEGRDILAVPGNIDRENSRGTNQLIRDGAIPVNRPGEILKLIGLDD